jgi:hypothetical protein
LKSRFQRRKTFLGIRRGPVAVLAFLAVSLFETESLMAGYPFNYLTTAQDISPPATTGWQTVDVSSYVPVNTTGIILQIQNGTTNPTFAALKMGVRRTGSTDDWMRSGEVQAQSFAFMMVGVDANRQVDLYSTDNRLIYHLIGYTMDGVAFFTNAVQKNPTTGSWQPVC